MSNELYFKRITEISAMIKSKVISPVELTQLMLDRIDRFNPKLNAYISVMRDEALAQARELEEEAARGHFRSPLHGIPISIKDVFDTKGHPTTGGSNVFKDWMSDKDATVVSKLKEAGAVIIGKNNLHEFCWGGTTENLHYGPSRNPWNPEKIPGGSSGGSAVAVAAGMAFGAIGTDTLGSVRLPSALCGSTAIKPTYGRVSRYGNMPMSWTFDHIGPMGRYVKDLALMLQVISGYDRHDPTSSKEIVDVTFERSLENLNGVVIGICREYFFDESADPEVIKLVEDSINVIESLGATVKEITIKGIDRAINSIFTIAVSEGYAFHKNIIDTYPELYGDGVREHILDGKGVSAQEYIDAQRYRNLFTQRLLEAMDSVDILLTPTNIHPAFSIWSVPPEGMAEAIWRLFRTPIGNLTGFPALSIPCGFVPEGLPVGLQLIGKPFDEKRILQIGDCFERVKPYADQLAENKAYENYSLT